MASSGGAESGESKVELIKRPREYTVEFHFPEVYFDCYFLAVIMCTGDKNLSAYTRR